jgi:hypothetical protein
MRRKKILFCLCLVFASCQPTTHTSFVKRSDAIVEKMCMVLSKVDNPQDFHYLEELKPLYLEMAKLLILSLQVEEKKPEIFSVEIIEAPHAEALKKEMMRIYEMEGGRSSIENAARDALILMQKSPYSGFKML